jgi:uncharacterized protein YbjT (DUF2867 family)
MYVITGITGQVGGAVARNLLAAGQPVRAVVRDQAKGRPWAMLGCEVVVAGIEDTIAMQAAFTGAQAVFAMLPPNFDPTPGYPETKQRIDALATALAAAKPASIVVLSTVGAQATQPNLLSQLGLLEQRLGQLDTPVAFLRSAWFMENFIWDIDAARNGSIDSFLQPLDLQIPMVATADIGATAASLMQQTWTGSRIVELAGANLSPRDVAAAFARLLGHAVDVRAVPRDSWDGIFRSQGMSNPLPRIQMLDGFNAGWIAFEGGQAERRRGATTLDAVLRGWA